MKLYIEIENNVPKNHPAFEDNLLQAFGAIPENWVAFERIEKPQLGVYNILDQEHSKYQLVEGVYKDVWLLRDMTAEEKDAKQQAAKDHWASMTDNKNFTAWVFDEVMCLYTPPVPRPDGGRHRWDGTANSWIEELLPAII